jgi:hypothetical protein
MGVWVAIVAENDRSRANFEVKGRSSR